MSLTRRVFLHRIAQLGGYSAAFASMQALGLLPAVGQSTLPQLPSDFGKGKKVVILGGGISGMVSAYELRKAGFDCTILEARNRLVRGLQKRVGSFGRGRVDPQERPVQLGALRERPPRAGKLCGLAQAHVGLFQPPGEPESIGELDEQRSTLRVVGGKEHEVG